MNGPEHYTEAERLLSRVENACSDEPALDVAAAQVRAIEVALAQVHATLAHTAATAAQVLGDYIELEDTAAGWQTAGVITP